MMACLVIYRLGYETAEANMGSRSGLQEYCTDLRGSFSVATLANPRHHTVKTSSSPPHGVSDGLSSPACWDRSENEDMGSGIHGLTLEDWNKSAQEGHGKEVEDNTVIWRYQVHSSGSIV
ncbi:hypothetical protein NCU17252 [Neurospora crassa OR74A]|uniref:Uncharacterized protein n=1 Tax=Neurospora crassa (strain ATCC 24698 / 74-OR23-1A / CBS 708.71 / DSM 1257 / FGSC 987) TaxID=367110 RepID=V5IL45_NEUCR|nr:hypothetical protein NCU17252 [Neurospora crassa OR74A]ESA42030.1 hypothetical protein NCU17252 [Neurospora crassa OR74A]|eukprot:XP_011395379.1 hypothetical protein NCU17252 [Neurospora crassa OR74A]